MHTGRAVLVHPAALRTPWHEAFAVATLDVAKHLALTLAVTAAGSIAVSLLLLLAVVAAPLGLALATWVLWRSTRDGARGVRRLTLRARRRARALGLRMVRGAAGT
jgi:hypothetical protein